MQIFGHMGALPLIAIFVFIFILWPITKWIVGSIFNAIMKILYPKG